jgi:glycosyltransferase involved in cell wall biosynthesis
MADEGCAGSQALSNMSEIHCLLVSPLLPATDPRFGGDHGYTQTLLSHPPDGVRYYHHEALIAQGRGRRIRPIQILVHQLRLKGLIAPGLWFESFETDFVPDLIHIVSFSALVRIHGTHQSIPVIIGTSTGSTSDLRYYCGWSEPRVRRARTMQRMLLRLLGAYETALNPRDARRILVWSEFARKLHLEESVASSARLTVLPPGLPPRPVKSCLNPTNSVRFLFIGRDFERKNGRLMLEAFRQIHNRHSQTELILIGQPADRRTIQEEGVTHYLFMPRQQLIEEIIPKADVLVLPSKAEGFGLVLLEAMACDLALIGVDAYAMPEIIQHGRNGFLIRPDSLDDLVKYMELLATQPDLLCQLKRGSNQVFAEKFTVDVHNQRLRMIYDQALAENGVSP